VVNLSATASSQPSNPFLASIRDRVLVADGAMGTMLHAANPTVDDYQGHEGCSEILCLTMPDVVRGIHEAYLRAGADCVETNSFGANLSALGEYGLADRIFELSQAAARLAREVADGFTTPDRPRFVLGSMGPGTKLPTLGHVSYADLREGYRLNAAGPVS
jgi:5-methyltetrahydrofolate--homocysteine methyltransferase